MTDQAEKLRDLVLKRSQDMMAVLDIDEARKQVRTEAVINSRPKLSARVIAVTSGKGGVGKTNIAINLAIHMRRRQKRLVLLDTDFGLANVEVLFGVNPKYNFGDVLAGIVGIDAAMTAGPMGIQFLSGGSGLTALSNITEQQMGILIDSFAFLDEMADIILVDTGAGVSMVFPSNGSEIAKTVSTTIRGTSLSCYNIFTDIAYGFSAPVAGFFTDRWGDGAAYLFAALCATVGMAMMLNNLRLRRGGRAVVDS